MSKVPTEVSDYMKKIGARGGAKGRGKKKARDAAHYQKMVAARKRNQAKRK
jgi:hypothetical protein